MESIVALVIATFFAANIGASGTAAAMGEPYGGGALKSKRVAMLLVAVFAFLGAAFGGQHVVKTISGGLVPAELIDADEALLILASACLTLFVANLLGIPLSTSEVTVGSVVGLGLAFGEVFYAKLALIALAWLLLPLVSFFLMVVLGRFVVRMLDAKVVSLRRGAILLRILAFVLILSGCYEAFSAGMNNVANAVGPLVGADLIDSQRGTIFGGIALSIGALALGGRVLETNAKRIAKISLIGGSVISLSGATLVVVASMFGIPVPLTQATTAGIMGLGYSQVGKRVFALSSVRTILRIWATSPVISLVLTYTLATAFHSNASFFQPISIAVVLAGLLTAHMMGRSLASASRSEKGAFQLTSARLSKAEE